MGDIILDDYTHVVAWFERIKKLPGFVSVPGLDDCLVRRKDKTVEQILADN